MNDILPSTPKRMAFFSGAALLLATLQFGAIAFVYYSLWIVPRQQPPRNLEWGEGMGAMVFLFEFVMAHAALVVVGLVLIIFSLLRHEQPIWPRQTAIAIYVPAAAAVVTLAVWRLIPK